MLPDPVRRRSRSGCKGPTDKVCRPRRGRSQIDGHQPRRDRIGSPPCRDNAGYQLSLVLTGANLRILPTNKCTPPPWIHCAGAFLKFSRLGFPSVLAFADQVPADRKHRPQRPGHLAPAIWPGRERQSLPVAETRSDRVNWHHTLAVLSRAGGSQSGW